MNRLRKGLKSQCGSESSVWTLFSTRCWGWSKPKWSPVNWGIHRSWAGTSRGQGEPLRPTGRVYQAVLHDIQDSKLSWTESSYWWQYALSREGFIFLRRKGTSRQDDYNLFVPRTKVEREDFYNAEMSMWNLQNLRHASLVKHLGLPLTTALRGSWVLSGNPQTEGRDLETNYPPRN